MNKRAAFLLSATALLAAATTPAQRLWAQTTQAAPSAQAGNEGVSTPPSDDTIQATVEGNADTAPTAPNTAKPQPGIPANSDDAMVSVAGSPSAPAATAPAPTTVPQLVARPLNPDDEMVHIVPSPSNQLAEGTDIRVRLLDALSTRSAQDGQPFHAQVAADVYKEGRVIIPLGSELRGRVVSVTQGHRFGSPATLRLRPDAITLPDGSSYHLYAQAVHVEGSGTRTDSEGGIQPKSRVTKDLVEYGAAAGGGAATGAVLGGPVGAAAGALVGAGVITTHLLLQHPQQAVLAQGSEITFSLTEPMDLLASRN